MQEQNLAGRFHESKANGRKNRLAITGLDSAGRRSEDSGLQKLKTNVAASVIMEGNSDVL
jgi:hypothetical protein